MLHYMTTRQAPRLLSTSVTSTLKKSGLHCEAGSFRSGGFRASQINEWRDGRKIGVACIAVSFYAGWDMVSPADSLAKAVDVLIDKGYSVKVNPVRHNCYSLTVTIDSEKDGK